MKTIDLAKAGASLSEYAQRLRKGPLVLTRGGRPVAAMIRVTARDLETLLLSENPRFQAIIRRSRAEYRKKGGVSLNEARRLVEGAPKRKSAKPGIRRARRRTAALPL